MRIFPSPLRLLHYTRRTRSEFSKEQRSPKVNGRTTLLWHVEKVILNRCVYTCGYDDCAITGFHIRALELEFDLAPTPTTIPWPEAALFTVVAFMHEQMI